MNHLRMDNFSQDQHTAVEMCADPTVRIASVTGEAGTGKTSVLGQAVETVRASGYSTAICAPTGRAAARIRELLDLPARTAHRLLGYGAPDPNDPDDFSFPTKGKGNPIGADFIFVDESSMLSEELYRNLVDAMRKNACIRFFGDIHQLPPVMSLDPPFKRVLERFPKVILTKNFRSDDGIVQAAQTIIRGRLPKANERFKIVNVPNQIGLSMLDKFLDHDIMDVKKAQIIAPTRIGKIGTQVINGYIQQKLNDHPKTLELHYIVDRGEEQNVSLHPGDKILWTKNDYNLNLFNGMIGHVLDFDEVDGAIAAEFEGRDYVIPSMLEYYDELQRKSVAYDPRKYIDLAYAITTHKSQGSEFDRVIIMLYWSGVLSRQNFYTAVTRGRKHVTVIAGPGGLKAALINDPVMEPKK